MILNFCGSLFLRIDDFLEFAGLIFCDCKKLVSLLGSNFCAIFGKSRFIEIKTFRVLYINCMHNCHVKQYVDR